MAYRGQSALHPALKDMVTFNKISCLYEVKENGIIYAMPFGEFQILKRYFSRVKIPHLLLEGLY